MCNQKNKRPARKRANDSIRRADYPNTKAKTPVTFSGPTGNGVTINETTELWITLIDVGQGESTLIRYRTRTSDTMKDVKVVLIDGGRERYVEDSIRPTLNALGVQKIDVAVCTHYDADHMEGLTKLAPIVDKMYQRSAKARGDDSKVAAFRRAYKEKTHVAQKNSVLCEEGNFSIKCVTVDNTSTHWDRENDSSIGLLVKFGNFKYFTGGDLTSEVEDKLDLGHVCAFKCSHHGSKHSSSASFLEKHTPSAALISAGAHSYCHPDDELIARLCEATSIQKFYLTNCCYNRGGINPNFVKFEDDLLNKVLVRLTTCAAKVWVDGARDQIKDATHEILRIVADTGTRKNELIDAIRIRTTEHKPSRKDYEKLEPPEARNAVRSALDAYLVAKDMLKKKDSRALRKLKGIVASSKEHLGNIHLVVSGSAAQGAVQLLCSCRQHVLSTRLRTIRRNITHTERTRRATHR